MKSREFYKLIRELLDPVLKTYGFSRTGSRRANYHRIVSGNIYHIIEPWLTGRTGDGYEIRVLATSPLIDISFDDRFPDRVGMPEGRLTSLHPEHGMQITNSQYRFKARRADFLVEDFGRKTKQAIERFAIPYLNDIQNIQDLRSAMTETSTLDYGLALWHTGDVNKAINIIKAVLSEHQKWLQVFKSHEPVAKRNRASHEDSVQFETARIEFITGFLNGNSA